MNVEKMLARRRIRRQSLLEELQSRTRRTEVLSIDVESPVSAHIANASYSRSWVVLFRAGVPRRVVILDHPRGWHEVEDELEHERQRVLGTSETPTSSTSIVSDRALPRISVVIPSIVKRLDDLTLCLDSLELLDYPNYEVILVDNRRQIPEPDPLASVARERPWLSVVREATPGISAARNTGSARATGEILAYTDEDVRVDRHWLRAIAMRMMREPEVDALTGLVLPAELETPAQVWFEQYFKGMGSERTFTPVTLEANHRQAKVLRGSQILATDDQHRVVKRFSIYGVGAYGAGANLVVRKSAFDRVGGFDLHLGVGTATFGGEDLALLIDILWAGGAIAYEPAAFVHHRHRREYTELLHQIDGYGIGFTAMLASLILKDPRHALTLAWEIPRAVKWKSVQLLEHARSNADAASGNRGSYPTELFRRELAGFFRGPFIYARSRLA